ncbi:MAG: hypothetical protein H0W16_08715 [Actinobacteria bacterium]|nr:hypothetical protein [Actinomycetota bacterium]
MQRVNNEFVWVTVVSIVCGIAVASLLSGSGLPLLLIVLVVALGAGVAALRRRGHAPSAPMPRWRRAPRAPRDSEPEPPAEPRRQPRQPTPLTSEPWSRRAGVRSRSLGEQPPTKDRERSG